MLPTEDTFSTSPLGRPTTMSLLRQYIVEDIGANPRDPRAILILISFRATQYIDFKVRAFPVISRICQIPYRLMTEFFMAIELRPKTCVGRGLRLYHSFGVVIHDSSRIGDSVTIRQGVTIGIARTNGGAPQIHDGVDIGAGVIILGPIIIGSGAIIGAGSVVTRDVASGQTVMGIPARARSANDK